MPFFIAPWFLLATAAAAIPVALHLLHRRKPKPVPFSSLRFLTEAVAKTKRSRHLTNFLILLLRVLILLLLALAFAQPKVRFAKWLPVDKRTVILVLDGSASMRTLDGNMSCFNHARDWALQLVRSLEQGDQVALIIAGLPEPRRIFPAISDQQTLIQALQDAEPGYGSSRLVTLLHDLLRRSGDSKQNFGTELHIFSDFQDEEWSTSDVQVLSDELNRLEMLLFLNRVRPAVAANAGITRGTFSPPAILGDGQFTVHTAMLAGPDFAGGNTLRLQIAGSEQNRLAVQLLSQQETIKTLSGSAPAGTDSVKGTLELEPDIFAEDNIYYFCLPRLEGIPLLIVDGGAGSTEPDRDVFFLQRAVQPRGRARTIFVPQVLNWQSFTAADLSPYMLVYLCNPPALDDVAVTKLESYVSSGGTVMLLPGRGERFSDEIHNLTPFAHLNVRREELAQEESLSIIASQTASNLEKRILATMPPPSAIVVRQRLQFANLPPAASTAFHYADGHPFLLEMPYGQGSFWLSSVSANRDWSEWPLTPFFVILQQELVKSSAHRSLSERTVRVGDILPLEWSEAGTTLEFRHTSPTGSSRMVSASRPEPDQPLLLSGFHMPGFHTLERNGKIETVAVNIPPGETTGNYLQMDELKFMFQHVPLYIAENWHQQQDNLVSLHKGRPLWPLLLLIAFALTIAEELFANIRSHTSRLPDALRQFLLKGARRA